jgi:hypothetical protein
VGSVRLIDPLPASPLKGGGDSIRNIWLKFHTRGQRIVKREEVKGQRIKGKETRGRESEDRGQRTEVRSQETEV